MINRKTFLSVVIGFAVLAGVSAAGYVSKMPASKQEAASSGFGASFRLIADNGQPITEAALKGHPSLVFFGFTHCPEICPTTLFEMSGWFKTLGPGAKDLHAFFFSVDPERDTPETMRTYVSSFSDKVTGITGDPAEVQRVIKGWRIYAKKVPTDDGDYTMDHTASVLLVDANGDLKGTIAYQESADSAVDKIRQLLK
ncbi:MULTISPECIES: SCO family protein [unclassified Rhizobium]|uniref:SCO family protein n=1 Tax=unclassified Rhizobium TaxID=2613769 RepID=UPI000DDE78C3